VIGDFHRGSERLPAVVMDESGEDIVVWAGNLEVVDVMDANRFY
jgi:hypothetical protein